LLVWGTSKRQPGPATEFAQWAHFVTTDEFRWSHLVASIGGQTAGVVGTVALTALMLLRGAPVARSAIGLLLHLVGSSLMLTGFGIAAFAQPAIGELHRREPGLAKEMYDAVYSPAAFVVLLTGLTLFSFSTVATGSALRSTAGVPRWVGRVYAVAGPVFGVVGFLVGTFQTIGAVALATAAAVAAQRLRVGAAAAHRGSRAPGGQPLRRRTAQAAARPS
jgi:hypothetical protein